MWLGDTVVQLTNDYEKKVFNGDVGRVVSVFREGSAPRFRVEFETVGDIVGDGELGGERDSDAPPPVVDYSKANLGKDVALSYAMTVRIRTRLGQGGASPNRSPPPLTPLLPPLQVHKAQGSEYPVVVLPVLPQHGAMLYRNLLYTAVSRARRLLVLVGDERAIETAVGEDKMQRRETLLAHRISDDRFASAATKHL